MRHIFLIAMAVILCCITNAGLISLTNYQNGTEFHYTFSSGNEPYYFGGYTNVFAIHIPSTAVTNVECPEGWFWCEESDIVSLFSTNSSQFILNTNKWSFVIHSNYGQATVYGTGSSDFPPGIAQGEIYLTNGNLFTPEVTLGNIGSTNVVGYELFSFIGPVPEPICLWLIVTGLLFFSRRIIKRILPICMLLIVLANPAMNVQGFRLDARTILMQPTNQFNVTWDSQPGKQYTFKAKTNLSSNEWSVIPNGTVSATNTISSHAIAVTGETRFFMLEELDMPAGMALIPAGTFQMGDTFSEGNSDELPLHDVYIDAFYMDKYEVSKAKWDDVYNWAINNGYSFDNAGGGKATNHPVHTVNWFDCVKWCNARSEKEGKTPCYTLSGAVYKTGQNAPDCNWSANGYRLPTEAEWEKAARGGASGHRFPWHDTDTIQHARANYYSGSGDAYDTSPTRGYHPTFETGASPYTSPVGYFAANDYGLYDMAGNVWEWNNDWYSSSWYSQAGATNANTRGPVSGSYRMYRGGGWGNIAYHTRCAKHSCNTPLACGKNEGFRCVCL